MFITASIEWILHIFSKYNIIPINAISVSNNSTILHDTIINFVLSHLYAFFRFKMWCIFEHKINQRVEASPTLSVVLTELKPSRLSVDLWTVGNLIAIPHALLWSYRDFRISHIRCRMYYLVIFHSKNIPLAMFTYSFVCLLSYTTLSFDGDTGTTTQN